MLTALIQSGIKRFLDQSPPPMTLPALTEQILILFSFFLKKELMYEWIKISHEALEALYGTYPPNVSVSL